MCELLDATSFSIARSLSPFYCRNYVLVPYSNTNTTVTFSSVHETDELCSWCAFDMAHNGNVEKSMFDRRRSIFLRRIGTGTYIIS